MLITPTLTLTLALASASALAAAKGCQYGDLRNATWNLDVYEEQNCYLPSHSPQKHEWFGDYLTPSAKKWVCSPCGELSHLQNKVGSWVFTAEKHLWLSWYNNKGCKADDLIFPRGLALSPQQKVSKSDLGGKVGSFKVCTGA